jgi:protein arginine N-methyltransferase 1
VAETDLSPTTVLRRAPALKLRVHSDNVVEIEAGEVRTRCAANTRALAILDAFSAPTTFSDALQNLEGQLGGAQDWMDLTSTIVDLYRVGILRDESASSEAPRDGSAFGAPPVHVRMLDDRARTSSFLQAIEEVVQEGDVVVDLGTGTGILAVAAARAGAHRVYAIEATGMSKAAASVFEANEVSDRITLVEGWSTQVDLPERADVLVSEVIGGDPLDEGVLELTLDARTRFLKPGARLVPSRLRMYGLPVSVPARELTDRLFTEDNTEKWRSWYGIDFSPLTRLVEGRRMTIYVPPQSARDWTTLSDPVLLADADLGESTGFQIDAVEPALATGSGALTGVLIYFELDVGPIARLSTHPLKAPESNSWSAPVWLLADPLQTQAGDRFSLACTYRVPGKETGISISRG